MISTSTSNWLDRLRSSRGFPTGDEPDLNQCLSTSTSGSLPTTESTHFSPAILQPSNSGTGEISDVLSDLFNMGEPSRTFSKNKNKISRKQKNPRFFLGTNNNDNDLCSSDDLRREKSENELISSGDNSLNERKDNNFDEKEEIDLKGFSKNEVLVIDTSLLEWRFDGWVFRKNDEWKIKEKKIKSRVFCGNKKRKLVLSNLNDDKLLHKKKKMKMMKKKKYDEILSKEQHLNNDRREEPKPFKEVADSRGKVAQKRFPCPRPPEKLGKDGSSVILLKSIPLNDINVAAKVGKSSHKQKRPKKMKIV